MNGLMLAGGGRRGAHQIGALDFLFENGFYPEGFHKVVGCSIGGWNGSALSMFDPEEQALLAVPFIKEMWFKYLKDEKSILKFRFPKYIAALWNTSFAKTSHLESLFTKIIDLEKLKNSDVDFGVISVNLNDGEEYYFGKHDSDFVKGAIATGNYPLYFEPTNINGELYVDGGIRTVAPLSYLIGQGCDNILILTSSNPFKIDYLPTTEIKNGLTVFQRSLDIAVNQIIRDDLKLCFKINKWLEDGNLVKTKMRTVNIKIGYPLKTLKPAMDWNPVLIADDINQGYEDIKKLFGDEVL